MDILNNAIKHQANNIHFTLAYTGLIIIFLRSENLMAAASRITPEDYKKILNYIEIHSTFKPFNKGLPQSGILTIKDYQSVVECYVSILPSVKFKSLVLRIEKPHLTGELFQKKFVKICCLYDDPMGL